MLQGYDAVSFEALQAQLADALYNPTLPQEFQSKVRPAAKYRLPPGWTRRLLEADCLLSCDVLNAQTLRN